MHILFLTDNFPPEGNAPATRTYEHTKEWVKQGHKVTVITCAPNFPEGKVYSGYNNSLLYVEQMDGIEVRRVVTYITANEGFIKRTMDYLSFMISGTIAGLFVKKPDIVIATSPQFFCACGGWLVSLFRSKPFVFELRDIWPASITAVGAMKRSWVIRFLEKIELFLYRRADKIVAVTNSFKRELVERGISGSKIEVVLNGVDASQFVPRERDAKLANEHGLTDKFVAAYIGTHGLAHALETVVNAAERLQEREDIVFLLVGGGATQKHISELVDLKNIRNIRILGRQDKSLMPRIWSLCDVSIVHLRNNPVFRDVIPSKIFESFAMGIPVMIGIPKGEATDLVSNSGGGLVIPPENGEIMASEVEKLADSPERWSQLSHNALAAAGLYDRTELATNMLNVLKSIQARKSKS